jgi:FkbM family methyltransferase
MRLIPDAAVVRIRSGVNRGRRWVYRSGNYAFWLGTYEEDKQQLLDTLVKPGMVIWDVGANIGFYTLAFSQLTTATGFVYAFEPLGTNFGKLLTHIRLNELTNVTAVQGALSDADGLVGFDTGPNALMGRLDADLRQYLIPTLTADGFVARYPQAVPDLIKIDVEGA